MIRELNIALIGCGNWGKNIARNLHQMGSLACIYDTNSALSKKLSHEYNLPIFEINKIFEDKNINGIVIASPAKTHKDLAIRDYVESSKYAIENGLEINAGHDLDMKNLAFFVREMPYLDEVSIGHGLISESLFLGLEKTISCYKEILS